jgi:filamentous hemagglutinin
MNQHLYRIIFDRERSRWMAVRESASGGPGAPGVRAISPLAGALALLLAAPTALAQIIVDPSAPGQERPMVLNSANGTPSVQIQTPSAAGVSRNRYRQFDIGQQGERGAILNNSRTAVQSQIGGWVQANPWLANGSARVIVNEVQSAAQSRLAGTLEVAGQRADVIIANPSGLVVNGMSLINASGLTLTTGMPRYGAQGSLDGFSVRGGAIHVEGRGLDTGQANYAQVLARAITLNAGVWAQDLRMASGINELSADGQVQSSTANGRQAQPQFALDVAHLGGMYAHKITLIGTEAGLGVRNAGTLAAGSGSLTLSVDGQLSNSGVMASQGDVADLEISAPGIANTGTLVARRLDLSAASLDNAGQVLQTGPQLLEISSLAVSNQGEKAVLGVPAPQALAPAHGPAPTATPAPVDGAAPQAPEAAEAVLRHGRIHLSQRLVNTGQLLANGMTDVKTVTSFVNRGAANLRELHSEGLLDNRKGALQLQRLSGAQTAVLNTQGSLFVASDLRLVAHHIDNTGGALHGAQSLSAEARTLTNDAGTLSAGGNLTLKAHQLENTRGAHLLSHGGSVQLTATQALNNQQARIAAAQGLHIDSGALDNRGGTLQTTGTPGLLHITSGAGVDNSAGGLIQSSGNLALHAAAGSVNNTGATMDAKQDLLIQSRGLVDNSQGLVQAGNALLVHDAGVAQGMAPDTATQTLANQGGKLFSANILAVRNQAITGAGRLDALGDLTLNLSRDLTHQGTTAANGQLQVQAPGRVVNQGQLLGGRGTQVTGTQIENQHGGEISARHNITELRASQGIANRGLIDGQDSRLDAHTVDNIGTGRIYGDHLSIAAQQLTNRPEQVDGAAPVIAARRDLDLGVPVVVNAHGATLRSLGDMRLGASLDANRHATGRGQRLDNIGTLIDAQGNMKLDMQVVNNLNAGVETASLADVETRAAGDLIALEGKEPESAALYREVKPGTFVPFSANKGGFQPQAGIPGAQSDGRMFRPVHPDKFLGTLPAALIVTETSSKYGDDFPKDVHLQLEPVGSARFAEYGIALPKNYTTTAPSPAEYGALVNDAGRIEWQDEARRKAFDAAWTAYGESIKAADQLHQAVLKVVEKNNQTLDSARIYTRISDVTQTIHRDRVTQTKSARIEAAGNLDLADSQLNNVDSSVIAAGFIHGKTPNNQATKGKQRTLTEGHAIRYTWKFHGGGHGHQSLYSSASQPYASTAETTFELPTVVFKQHHPRGPATALDANTNSGQHALPPAAAIREHGTDSGLLARTLEAGEALPQSSLYALHPASANQPLIETDPAFTRGQPWTSSEQLLDALGPAPVSPAESLQEPPQAYQFPEREIIGQPHRGDTPYRERLQKRLGDGFYEQQLVQRQVGQLTGRRFLGDYRSNDAQYQALLHSGTTFAKAHGLRPGVALSAAQMAKLTSDMVWLVEQNVTLPDGAVQKVLVPKVYVVAKPGDLDVQGGLISANVIVFDTDQDAHNSATIAGRKLVKIAAHDINNVAGNITGKVVGLHAKRDINVEGGTISATEALLAHAERDINAASSTRSSADGKRTVVDRVAAFALLPDQGNTPAAATVTDPGAQDNPAASGLTLYAGRDIRLRGVQLANAVKDSATLIDAERDIHLGTVATTHDVGVTWNPKNHLFVRGGKEVGTEIHTQGLAQLLARNDINARAAQVQSAGELLVSAQRNVNITAGQTTRALDDAYFRQRSGFLGSSSTTYSHQVEATGTQASHLGGKTVDIKAGQDIALIASNVLSDSGTKLDAKGSVSILAAPETSSHQSHHQSKRSGVFGGGGLGVTIGSQSQSTDQRLTRTASAPSTVGSMQGHVEIIAGNAYRQIGSDLFAPAGDVKVKAKDIKITGTPETEQGTTRSQSRQSGLTVSLSSPVIGIAQTASHLADAAGRTSDSRMQALAAGAAALNIYTQQDLLHGLATGKGLNLGLNLSLGSSKSQSERSWTRGSLRQSQVVAGGNASLEATGAGKQSNLLIQDSQVHAGKKATLISDNRIDLLTTPGSYSESSSNSSRSAGVGMSLGAAGPAFSASASGSKGKGRSQSEERIHSKTRVTGGEGVDFHAGGDMLMREAVVSAQKVLGRVGGDQTIESLQDTSRFEGKQSSASGSVGLGIGYAAGSAGLSSSRARGDFASTGTPAGIQAGDGGFDLEVKGKTELKGAVIASTQGAIDKQRNRLVTSALVHSDIENFSNFEASGFNLSGGITTGGQKQGQATGSDTVTDPAKWSTQNLGRAGTDAAAAGVSRDSGRERSITRSGVSPGTIVITDEAAQQALTGHTAAETVASLNRDVRTGDPNPGLTRKWDGKQLMQEQAANAETVAAFGQQASKAIGQYAQQQMATAAELRHQAQRDPARAAELNAQAQDIEKNWGNEGVARVLAHGVVGGLTGGAAGAAGSVAATITGPAIAEAFAKAGVEPSLSKILTAIATTATATAAAGAPGAATALNEVANNYLKHLDVITLSEKLSNCQANDQICNDSVVKEAKVLSQNNIKELLACGVDQQCVQNRISEYMDGARSFHKLYAADKGEDKKSFGAMSDMQTQGGLIAANLSAGNSNLSQWVGKNCVALTTSACSKKFLQAAENSEILSEEREIGYLQDKFSKLSQSKIHHQYTHDGKICWDNQSYCTTASAFSALRQFPAPGSSGTELIVSGSVSNIELFNNKLLDFIGLGDVSRLGYVTHLVDPTTLSIVNITLPKQHGLDPGWVFRQVQNRSDGIYIYSYGAGTGANPFEINTKMARPVWGGNLFFSVTPEAQFPHIKNTNPKMKSIKKILIFFFKTLVLAICGVISSALLTPIFSIVLDLMHPYQYGQWIYLYHSPIKYKLVFIFCLIFGAPLILITDKLFTKPYRYVLSGAASSIAAWTILDGGTAHSSYIWNSSWPMNWKLGLFFLTYGALTGILFTLTLFILGIFKKT